MIAENAKKCKELRAEKTPKNLYSFATEHIFNPKSERTFVLGLSSRKRTSGKAGGVKEQEKIIACG